MRSDSHRHRGHDRGHDHGDGGARRFVHRMFGMGGPGSGPRHERGPHGHGGRNRLGRLFEHGDLRFVILSLIAEKPRHGYEVIKAIEEKVAGAYAPSPGVVYPTLTMLEELGYATVASAEAGKKLYAITEEGRAHLAANQPAVAAIFARMTEASEAMGGGLSPQILRAMENLRFALKLRLTRGPLAEDQVQRIVAVMDDAARAIEQI